MELIKLAMILNFIDINDGILFRSALRYCSQVAQREKLTSSSSSPPA
jgi:hypothetical protein